MTYQADNTQDRICRIVNGARYLTPTGCRFYVHSDAAASQERSLRMMVEEQGYAAFTSLTDSLVYYSRNGRTFDSHANAIAEVLFAPYNGELVPVHAECWNAEVSS